MCRYCPFVCPYGSEIAAQERKRGNRRKERRAKEKTELQAKCQEEKQQREEEKRQLEKKQRKPCTKEFTVEGCYLKKRKVVKELKNPKMKTQIAMTISRNAQTIYRGEAQGRGCIIAAVWHMHTQTISGLMRTYFYCGSCTTG